MRNKNGRISVGGIFATIFLTIILIVCFKIYRINFFNDFEKATVEMLDTTNFSRDPEVKYSDYYSYRIENAEFNDATIYKEIDVEPNTPYRISCMAKTKNVVCQNPEVDGGVVIGILETTEYSDPITGTNDWQKVEYMFNSRNREKVKISFRLGGNQNACTGTVWFSDFKVEKGTKNTDTEWKVGCYIIKELDVNIDGNQYNFKTNLQDEDNVRLNMERYKDDCYRFSNKKMTVNYEINKIETPIKTISYSDEHGYFIDYIDVKDAIYKDALNKKYDHIFVVCRMENEAGTLTIPIEDNWIGLGSMDMYGIGYSLIRINKNSNTYTYKYGITNQAPEEVYVHEFLHTLERNEIENGYDIPALHDYEKYGYTEKNVEGLNQWYKDYMAHNINGGKAGLSDFAYSTQPPNEDNFTYAVDTEFNIEPQNVIEYLLSIIDIVKKGRQ